VLKPLVRSNAHFGTCDARLGQGPKREKSPLVGITVETIAGCSAGGSQQLVGFILPAVLGSPAEACSCRRPWMAWWSLCACGQRRSGAGDSSCRSQIVAGLVVGVSEKPVCDFNQLIRGPTDLKSSRSFAIMAIHPARPPAKAFSDKSGIRA